MAEPHAVIEQIEEHRNSLQRDVLRVTGENRRTLEAAYKSKRSPEAGFVEYLRDHLDSPRNGIFRDWQEHVRVWCRTLGADADAVDALVALLCEGDVSDAGAVRDAADDAFNALDAAMAEAKRQRREGQPKIGPPPVRSDGNAQEWSEAKSPADWQEELGITDRTWRRHINEGLLIVDRITLKRVRIRLDTLNRYQGK